MEVTNCLGSDVRMKPQDKINFISCLAISLVIIMLRVVFSVNIPVLLVLCIMSIPILTGGDNSFLAYAVCCMPLTNGFQYKYGLLIGLTLWVLRKRVIRKNTITTCIFFICIWEFLHIIMGYFSVVEYIRGMTELLTIFAFSMMDQEKIDYKFILKMFVVTSVSVAAIILLSQLKQYNFNIVAVFERGFNKFRFGNNTSDMENFGLNYNPNNLGFICNMALATTLLMISKGERNKILTAFAVMAGLFGILTLSRTFVLVAAFSLIVFVLYRDDKLVKKIGGFVGVILGLLIAYYLLLRFAPGVIDNIILRFRDSDVMSGNGRTDIFAFYLKHIFSSPIYFLFGLGIQNYRMKILDIYGMDMNVCHNGVEEIWVLWGIVGVLLMLLVFKYILSNTRKMCSRRNLCDFLPSIVFMLNMLNGQFVSNSRTMLALFIMYVSLCYVKNEEHVIN